MKALKFALQVTFGLFAASVGVTVAALAGGDASALAPYGPAGLGAAFVMAVIHIVVLSILADMYGRSGAVWAMSAVFGLIFVPVIGLALSYFHMLSIMAGGVPATGSANSSCSPAQESASAIPYYLPNLEKKQWRAIIAFMLLVFFLALAATVFH